MSRRSPVRRLCGAAENNRVQGRVQGAGRDARHGVGLGPHQLYVRHSLPALLDDHDGRGESQPTQPPQQQQPPIHSTVTAHSHSKVTQSRHTLSALLFSAITTAVVGRLRAIRGDRRCCPGCSDRMCPPRREQHPGGTAGPCFSAVCTWMHLSLVTHGLAPAGRGGCMHAWYPYMLGTPLSTMDHDQGAPGAYAGPCPSQAFYCWDFDDSDKCLCGCIGYSFDLGLILTPPPFPLSLGGSWRGVASRIISRHTFFLALSSLWRLRCHRHIRIYICGQAWY